MKKVILSLARIGFLSWIAVLLLILFRANSMMFKPQPTTYSLKLPYKSIETATGNKIVFRFIKNPLASQTILYSHGNAEDLGDIEEKLQYLSAKGYSVISYDYPGYGKSSGTPSEKSCYDAIFSIYDYLIKDEHIKAGNILLYGRSIGTGPTVELAMRRESALVILESPFVSAFQVITGIPLFPLDKFNNGAKIAKVTTPLLIMHGEKDGTIPFSHGERLFAKHTLKKHFFRVTDCDHAGVYRQVDSQFWELAKEFSTTSLDR